MGTRCLIGTDPRKLRYVHFDGYPSHIIPAITGYIAKHGWEKFCADLNSEDYSYLRSITAENMDKVGKDPELYEWAVLMEEKDDYYEFIYLWKDSKLVRFAAHGFTNLVADYSDILDDNYTEYWL
tara:strand:+ start:4054 stop:4428 length:375 start_codon:yes stop_codon:yes gene_type:complete